MGFRMAQHRQAGLRADLHVRREAVNADGKPTTLHGSFSTVAPGTLVRDGAVVATYDANTGSGASQDRVTRSGTQVVTEKWQDKDMSNPPYYEHAHERWAVRISNDGEFIHANPDTVGDQGDNNGPAMYGDPVEVTGSDVALSAADGDIYDWAMTWEQWRALSAVR